MKKGLNVPEAFIRPVQSETTKSEPVEESRPQKEGYLMSSGAYPMTEGKDGFFTDPRDGQVYKTIRLNGKIWMVQNLNFDLGKDCWFYDDDPKNGEKYGRLYTWESAREACPLGWRLPTDQEWSSLANAFGGCYDFVAEMGRGNPGKANTALIKFEVPGIVVFNKMFRIRAKSVIFTVYNT